MLTENFYSIIDKELNDIIAKYPNDEHIRKHKSSPANQKSYALLIWFLDFYGKTADYSSYITDGDNDGSCDIVFDIVDNLGKRVYYIIQSKWNSTENVKKEISKNEILQALNDFDTIIRGRKERVNDKLSAKLEALTEHLKNNGEVKFVFFALCNDNHQADDNIKSFKQNHRRTEFEIYDINRLKIDYIERKFKRISSYNPLESHYNPEEDKISLEVQKVNSTSGNFIRVPKPFESYVFLIKPKTIFQLFEKYGFTLFFRNVRNPLLESDFNREIERTAIDNPAFFWYYNNGLTAISSLLPTEIRDEATTIELTGLQIINGAQTVFSIYKAYKDASPTKQEVMDRETLITLRLLQSGGRDFDLNVTRYTNSQNPVNDRDFHANDEIQIRLQNESFTTKYWYEKRRGEFREIPSDIEVVPNHVFANAYLAYHLQDPVSVFNNFHQSTKTGIDLPFVSHTVNKDGLYEVIFNNETKFEDLLASFQVLSAMMLLTANIRNYLTTFSTVIYHILALFKTIFTKYCHQKYGNSVNVNTQLLKLHQDPSNKTIQKVLKFVKNSIDDVIPFESGEPTKDVMDFLSQSSQYEKIKGLFEDFDIDVAGIDALEIAENEALWNNITPSEESIVEE